MTEGLDFYRDQASKIESHDKNQELERLRLEIELEKLRLQRSQIEQGLKIEIQNNNIDFNIIKGIMYISDKEYTLDLRDRPEIKSIGDNFYELNLIFRRNSRSSLRSPENIKINFFYDGSELIFFGDKNNNQNFDRSESGKRYIIRHKQEIVRQNNRVFRQPREIEISLSRNQISSHQRINDLKFNILFE